jgi:hypothetical protein
MIKRLALLICLLFPVSLSAEGRFELTWMVVVNQDSGLTSLSQKQVMSLFLGRAQFLPGGSRVKTFDYPADSPMRAGFYQSLTGKNIADIDAYWARLKYSGRASPPQALDNAEAIIKKVSEQKGALSYLPSDYKASLADNGLVAVLTMKEP